MTSHVPFLFHVFSSVSVQWFGSWEKYGEKKSLCEAVVMCTRHENCKQKTYTFTQITNLCATSLEVKGTLQPSQNSIMKKWIWIFQVYVVSTCLPACCFMSIANLFMYLLYPTTTTTTTSRDGTWNEPLLEFIKIKSFFFPPPVHKRQLFFLISRPKHEQGDVKKRRRKKKFFLLYLHGKLDLEIWHLSVTYH